MTTGPSIQLATRADAAEIAALSRAEIEHGLPWRWTPRRVAAALADPATNIAVARQADGLLAGFGAMEYGDDTAHLILFAVHPAQRRQGIGSALLSWLEQVARAAGIATLRLSARQDNATALSFYRRHGYRLRATVPGMYLGLEDGVRLQKSLQGGQDVAP